LPKLQPLRLVNHFCPERCRAVDDKVLLLRTLRAKHGISELHRWLPRSYALQDEQERRQFIQDYAVSAAEALVESVSQVCFVMRLPPPVLQLAIHTLRSFNRFSTVGGGRAVQKQNAETEVGPDSECVNTGAGSAILDGINRRTAQALGAAAAAATAALDRSAVDGSAVEAAALAIASEEMAGVAQACSVLLGDVSEEDRGIDHAQPHLLAAAKEAVAELRRTQDRQPGISSGRNLWLLKPPDLGCGRGISVGACLPDLLQSSAKAGWRMVAQKYVERPLLPDGRKMDLRVWVLVLRWQPMLACLVEEPYVRLASKQWSSGQELWNDPLVHLTNRCQQTKAQTDTAPAPLAEEICWTKRKFCQWLADPSGGGFGSDAWENRVWPQLTTLVRSVLQAMEPIQDPFPDAQVGTSSFEVYGFDVLLDEALHPWLLEVNCSPDLCHDADVSLRDSVCENLRSALALVCTFHDDGDAWLPSAADVAASPVGLRVPGSKGWRIVMGGSGASGEAADAKAKATLYR